MAVFNKHNKVGIDNSPIFFNTPPQESVKETSTSNGRRWAYKVSPFPPPLIRDHRPLNKPLKNTLKIKIVKPHLPDPIATRKHAEEMHDKFQHARDNAGKTIHTKATGCIHSAEDLSHIKEGDKNPVKIGKVLLGSTLSAPLLAAKVIYYIPAATAYTLTHPKNAWKNTHDKALELMKEMKDPKFSGRIAGGLAGAGVAQAAFGDVPVACTFFISSGFVTLGSLTATQIRKSHACDKRRATPTNMLSERRLLEEKIKLYDTARVFDGFGEGFIQGALGTVVENTLLTGLIPSWDSPVVGDSLTLPDSPELLEVEFEEKESQSSSS